MFILKRVYIDFEMNMPNSKSKRAVFNSDIIAIGAVMYDEKQKILINLNL